MIVLSIPRTTYRVSLMKGLETMIPDLLADSHLQQVPRLAREVKKSDKVRM